MRSPIVVVGSFVQDLSWGCPEFPCPGQTVMGRFTTGPGGKGSNQAVAAVRAGTAAAFIGAVGKDAFGEGARDFYTREGIPCHLAEYEEAATATAAILVNEGGQNQIIVDIGANAFLSREDIPEELIQQARVLVCQFETNMDTNRHVLRLAKEAGVTTVLNPAPMRADFHPDFIADVDVLIPNETEFAELVKYCLPDEQKSFSAQDIFKLSGQELNRVCRAFGVPNIIVTLGSRGCFVSTPADCRMIPACEGINVVDTTGAGDAFVGGFAAGLVQFGSDVFKAAEFGNAVAALSVSKPGTAPAMPHREEIEIFLG